MARWQRTRLRVSQTEFKRLRGPAQWCDRGHGGAAMQGLLACNQPRVARKHKVFASGCAAGGYLLLGVQWWMTVVIGVPAPARAVLSAGLAARVKGRSPYSP